jgi:hypothetical protein
VAGDQDLLTPVDHARGLVALIGDNASLLVVEGGGHTPIVRDCVRVSLAVRDVVERLHPPAAAEGSGAGPRALRRPRRALFLSAPIGLGHTRRDVAIARELRALHPDLQIDWLSSDPVTRALEAAGERGAPRERLARLRGCALRVRGARSRPARLPGAAPDGRGLGAQLHGAARRGGR